MLRRRPMGRPRLALSATSPANRRPRRRRPVVPPCVPERYGNRCVNQRVPPNMPKVFTEAERDRFLEEKHIGVLSVAARDGRPPASVPIWYDYAPGGNIRINTGASRRKAKLIERAGVVTLVVQREELPYQYVRSE